MTLNAEWLTYTADETDKDPWTDDFVLDEHYERIAGIIETLDADVVNLVEVTSKDSVDYLVNVLHAKGLTAYKGFHIESNDTGTGQDVAVISKHTPDTVDGKKLRKFYSTGQGSTWRADYTWKTAAGITKNGHTSVSKNTVYCFTVGSHKLGFLGLHLKAFPNDPKSNGQRTGQSKVAQKIIREQIVAKGYTPIVLGDINDFDPDVPDRDPRRQHENHRAAQAEKLRLHHRRQ